MRVSASARQRIRPTHTRARKKTKSPAVVAGLSFHDCSQRAVPRSTRVTPPRRSLLALADLLLPLQRLEHTAGRLERDVDDLECVDRLTEVPLLPETVLNAVACTELADICELVRHVRDLVTIRVDRQTIDRAEIRQTIGLDPDCALVGQELEVRRTNVDHERRTAHVPRLIAGGYDRANRGGQRLTVTVHHHDRVTLVDQVDRVLHA